jgi:RNA polymerase sigma factor (sigma-70 family)
MSEVTRILTAIEQGDANAAEQLLPLVYDELRKLAAQGLAQERPGQTLQATALVHEAYLRIVASTERPISSTGQPMAKREGEPDCGPAARWNGRAHFFRAAAEAMRRILIDRARRRLSAKHGGDCQTVSLDAIVLPAAPAGVPTEDLLALDEALELLEAESPEKAQLVKLRYFTGLSLEETAQILDISTATAKRWWIYARSWLYGKLHGD